MNRVINKEEIPNWEYGDVCVKSYSFGDRLKLASMAVTTKIDEKTMKGDFKSKEIDPAAMGLFTVAAGIMWIKDKKNYEFKIDSNRKTEDLIPLVDNMEYDAAMFLKDKISELNKPLTPEEEKNS